MNEWIHQFCFLVPLSNRLNSWREKKARQNFLFLLCRIIFFFFFARPNRINVSNFDFKASVVWVRCSLHINNFEIESIWGWWEKIKNLTDIRVVPKENFIPFCGTVGVRVSLIFFFDLIWFPKTNKHTYKLIGTNLDCKRGETFQSSKHFLDLDRDW